MSAPFHVLKHEHRVIEKVLRALEGVCFRLKAQQVVPVRDILLLVDFISGFANGYHHFKEEKYLFPVLERQGITREGGLLEAIEQEHKIEPLSGNSSLFTVHCSLILWLLPCF